MKKNYKLIIFILFLIIFITLVIMICNGKISSFDDGIYKFIISFKSYYMTKFMKIITKFANTSTIIILCIASLSSLFKKYKGSIYLCLNIVLSTVLNLILKYCIQRPRPELGRRLIEEAGYSFPSGHAMASISFYGFLIFLILNSDFKMSSKIILTIILSLIIILVGISRIYLGVHYPSDIIGGYLVSLCLLIVTTSVILKYRKKDI